MSEPANTPTDSRPLSGDVATRVLQADLRNQVAKVAAGDTLPSSERARFEVAALTNASPEEIERLAKDRQAALLKIWSSGKRRLSPAEYKEIEPILPNATTLKPTTPAPAARRARYAYPLEHYTKNPSSQPPHTERLDSHRTRCRSSGPPPARRSGATE